MPSGRRIFAFFCFARDHKPQNAGCVYTSSSFHTGWTHRFKTFLSVTAIALAVLGKLTPAQSQVVFGAFQAETGDLASDPSCINGNALRNAPTCAVVGADGGLWVNRFDGTGFTNLGGVVIGKPSCTQFGYNPQTLCGVVGTDGSVFVNVSSHVPGNSSWSGFRPIGGCSPECGWNLLAGASISDPVCTGLTGTFQAICAIIRPNGSLAVAQSSDGAGVSWTTFADLGLGGTQIFNPTCTRFTLVAGNAFCGAVTTAGDFRVKFYNGTTWDPNATIVTFPPNISPVSDPSCTMVTSASGGRHGICGVRGSDSALYVSQLNGSTFSPFQSLGGIIRGAPSCTSETFSVGYPRAVCAVRGLLNEFYVNQFNNGTWSGFQLLTGVIFNGDPSCQLVLTGPGGSSSAVVWCGVKSTASELWATVSSPPM